jgi:hypothetical protein
MNENLSERRLVENELIFRELNQNVVEQLVELKNLAMTHDQADLAPDTTEPILFYCECSDIQCTKRISLSPVEYEKIHEHSRYFVTASGHNTPKIERVIKNTDEYDIVEKNREPSQVVSG